MTQPETISLSNGNVDRCQDPVTSTTDETPCQCGTESVKELNTIKNDISSQTNSSCKKSYSQLKKKNSKKKKEKGKAKDEIEPVEVLPKEASHTLPRPQSSWLLRLFESKLCDMAIAIAYMFKSKESGVLAYLGNKLFVSHLIYLMLMAGCFLQLLGYFFCLGLLYVPISSVNVIFLRFEGSST